MKSEANKAIIGSVLLVSSQLIGRLLGLVSTLVLVRILIPEDFGIIAIAMIFINFFELMVVTGSSQYIIQKDTVDDDDINTCWTLDICLRAVIAVLLLIAAPFAALFFDEPRLQPVISSLCFLVIIGPFSNPEQHMHRRQQRYDVIFIIDLLRKGISVPTTITLALLLESYWAMVIGHLFSAVVLVIASYVLMPYRPRFTLNKVKEQWSFTKWIMFKGIIGYCRGQLDTFLVSKFFGTSQVGAYHVMKYVGTMPSSQIIGPATQPLFATFSRNKNDKEAMLEQFKLAFLVLAIIAIPLTVYVFKFSEPLVLLLMGEKWLPFHQVLGLLTILTGSMALGNLSSHIIMAFGRVKTLFYYDIITLVIMLCVLLSVQGFSINEFTLSRVSVDLIICTALFAYTVRVFLRASIMPYLVIIMVLLPIALGIVKGVSWLVQDIGSNFLSIVVSSITFSLVWLAMLLVLYNVHWHKTNEGRHLAFICRSVLKSGYEYLYQRLARKSFSE